MARSIRTIYDEMITEKESNILLNELQPNVSSYQTLMSDLTSASKVAVWRLLFFVVAVSIWTVDKLFDEHKIWVEKRIAEITPGTLFWYKKIALAFQMGDTLVWNTTTMKYEYANIDESTQIVKLCAVNEIPGRLVFKVAKLGTSGEPEKLDTTELNGFQNYMETVKYAGLFVNYISADADVIRLKLKVYYNPSVIAPDGSLLTNPSSFPVVDAVKQYLKLMPFNGVFNVTDLIDDLQQIKGVVNPFFISGQAKYGGFPFAPITTYYRSNAGYMVLDDSIPLNDALEIEYLTL